MIKLGEMQELEVTKKVDFGVYLKSLNDNKGEDKILLPIKQVPENTNVGDKISVFVYRDSNDRVIATVKKPRLVIGEIAYLKVVQMTNIGAFLNWGLEKDLFLPFKEQIGEIKLNGEYLFGLYIDKSERLCATMNLFKVLTTDSPYKVNDMVTGTVFSLKRGLGAMIAVEGKYLGLIHEGEILKPLHSGDVVEVRISNIKEDGKLDLSLKDAPRLQIDNDGEKILNVIVKNKGLLLLNDDSSPEDINRVVGLSKSSFKKAVGRLMKRNVVEMTKEGIRLADVNKKTEKRVYNKANSNTEKRVYNKANSNTEKRVYNKANPNTEKRVYNKENPNTEKRVYNKANSNTEKKVYNSVKQNTEKKGYTKTNQKTNNKINRTTNK